VYQDEGKQHKAAQFLEQALKVYKELLKTHPLTAALFNNLGLVYSKNNPEKAKPLLKSAVSMALILFGKQSAATANYQTNLGNNYRIQHKLKKAQEICEMALQTRESLFGDRPQTDNSLHTLGLIYQDQGKLTKAKQMIERAILIAQNSGTYTIATYLDTLGTILLQEGNKDKAAELCKEALRLREITFGSNSTYVAASCKTLGSVYIELGKISEAKGVLERGLAIALKIWGKDDSSTRKINELLADCAIKQTQNL